MIMDRILFEKRLIKNFSQKPEIIRFMRKVVSALNYDVSKFKKLTTKYYASLMALELQVIKDLNLNPIEAKKMIDNGIIDNQTESSLRRILQKNSIEIPNDLEEYQGLSTLLVQLGQEEYNLSDRNRRLRGLESNAQMLIKGGVSDSIANKIKDRREFILDAKDEQYFFKKIRENRAKAKDKKNERKIARIEAKQGAKTERTKLRAESGNTLKDTAMEYVGQVGGVLGNIFGGGGSVPQYEDDTLYGSSDLADSFLKAKGTEKDSKDLLLYGGLAVGTIVLLKVLKVF